jgi:DNA ligase-1
MSAFKPMLASPVDFQHVDFSNTWVSAKLDGIRAIIIDGVVMARSLKPIPNIVVQDMFGNRPELEGYDGELIVGEPNSPTVYRDTYSGVMSKTGAPDVKFYAFDHIKRPNDEYYQRFGAVEPHEGVVKVMNHPVMSQLDVLYIEQMYLNRGYEGVMLRAFSGPSSRYKYGRSTAKEASLLKLKRMQSDEATVVGYVEEMENLNEAKTNELGHTQRSSHAENKRGKDRLGALICKTDDGIEFNIGTGFDHSDREALWKVREKLPGLHVKFKSFSIGVKEAPRFPVFLGLRDQIDMSA